MVVLNAIAPVLCCSATSRCGCTLCFAEQHIWHGLINMVCLLSALSKGTALHSMSLMPVVCFQVTKLLSHTMATTTGMAMTLSYLTCTGLMRVMSGARGCCASLQS